jgi:hypothetical protein
MPTRWNGFVLAALATQFALTGCMVGDESTQDESTTDAVTLGVAAPITSDLTAAAFVDDPTPPLEMPTVATGSCSGRICFHGGDLKTNRVQVYYIWYGDWRSSAVPGLLQDFAYSLGNTPYYRINSTYSDEHNIPVNSHFGYGGSYWVGYTHGSSITNNDVGDIVRDAVQNHHLPYDRDGIYFVMGSRGVHIPGMCNSTCGWHSSEVVTFAFPHGAIQLPALYGFIGNPIYCEDKNTQGWCQAQSTGPNGSSAADGMASVLAHEISETVTDPNGDAWYGANHDESADLCAWTFGTSYSAPNGATANVHLGSRDWLLQRIYNRQLRRCTKAIGG